MQLSFDAADRLVELVEARHGPVPAEDAAQALYALRHVPAGLARSLLSDVVDGDARLAWRGASVGLAEPPGAALALEDATYVVVDLETTGLSPRSSAICEIGAVRVRNLELEERFETLVNPRRPLPAPIAALDGYRPERASRRAAGRARDAPLPRVRRRRRPRRPQRALRHGVPRSRGRAADRAPDRGARGRHRLARTPAARGPPEARRPLLARVLLRHLGAAVPPRARRRGGDRRDPARTDRARPGDGGDDGGAARRPLRAARTAARRQAPPRRRGADDAGRLPLPRPERAGALRRPRARPTRPAALLLPHRASAAGGGGSARRARAGRVARPRLRARGRARGAPPAARAPPAGQRAQHPARTGTSTCAGAGPAGA